MSLSSLLLTIPVFFVENPIEKYGIGSLSIVSTLTHNQIGRRLDHTIILFLTMYSMTHRAMASLTVCCLHAALKDYEYTYFYMRFLPVLVNFMRILIFHRYRIVIALAAIAAGVSYNERELEHWTHAERWTWHAACSTYLLMTTQV